jgi:hypothetical protein
MPATAVEVLHVDGRWYVSPAPPPAPGPGDPRLALRRPVHRRHRISTCASCGPNNAGGYPLRKKSIRAILYAPEAPAADHGVGVARTT